MEGDIYLMKKMEPINEIKNQKLNDVKWKEFKLEDIFNIHPGKRLTKSKMKVGKLPFIGATDSNNGVTNFVSNTNTSLDSNVLGVNYNGSVVENFYHPYDCIFSDDVKRLSFKDRVGNKYLYLFFKTIILQQKEKYRYGYKFNESRMKRQSISVPIDENGDPNWGFMEGYMKKLEAEITPEISFSPHKIIDTRELKDLKWDSFNLTDFFYIKRGNQNNMSMCKEGDIPLVSAKKTRNGYKAFISDNGKPLFRENILTLNNDGDGGVGIAYYQPHSLALDTHVTGLTPKIKINKYSLLFISRSITQQRDKYSHGYSINNNRLEKQKIMLPIKEDGAPDWEFMEQYMKGLENELMIAAKKTTSE